jgi:hypothetical protein
MQAVCIAGVTCPITPITPDELPFDFDLPISGVPNWGDALGLELCLQINSGICDVVLPDILPARPLPVGIEEQYIAQLKQQCQQGNQNACRELIAVLGRKCRHENNRQACDNLRALCDGGLNGGPRERYREDLDACRARRSCTNEQANELGYLKNAACDQGEPFLSGVVVGGRRCLPTDSCEDLARKVAQNLLCG